MAHKNVAPPAFIDERSQYAEYRHKLLRWARITKVVKKHQAEVVVYNLEGHPSGIQQMIDTALGEEIEENDDGMTKLIAYLDGIYKEDDMTAAWLKFKHFIILRKSDNQGIIEFVAEFEKHAKNAKDVGCVFSDIVLAFFYARSL